MAKRWATSLKSGIEIKTLFDTSSYSTVDKHIYSASKKRKAQVLVIDNAENGELPDEKLVAYVRKSRRFKRGKFVPLIQKKIWR